MENKYRIDFAHTGKGYAVILDVIDGKLEKVCVEKTSPWVGSGPIPKKDVHVSKLEKALQYKPIRVRKE